MFLGSKLYFWQEATPVRIKYVGGKMVNCLVLVNPELPSAKQGLDQFPWHVTNGLIVT